MGVIYRITNPNGQFYIGQTINYNNRLKRYKWLACKKQIKIYNSLLKYGFDAHVFDILEDNVAVENLNEREVFWINKLESCYKANKEGMNLNFGGNTPIWDKKRVDYFADKFKGNKNPFYGKKHSKETIKIISEKIKISLKERNFKPSRLAIETGAEKKRRQILCYDINGFFVSEYPSLTSFAKYLKVDVTTIRDVLKTNGWVKKTYTCRYKTENYLLKIAV